MNKTKKIILIFFLILVTFLLFKFIELNSVLNVLNQGASAAKDSTQITHMIGGETKTILDVSRYANEIYKIDSSHCPKKFQLAWLNYVQAYRRVEQSKGIIFTDCVIGLATRSSMPLVKDATKPIKVHDELVIAYQSLKRVALKYGVRITHK
jgi:hypothetical protein